MVQTKRGVPSRASTPASGKAAKLDPVVREAREVIKGIRAVTDFRLIQDSFNHDSMEMLSQMFPLAVAFREDRDRYQESIFSMVGVVVSELQRALKQSIVFSEASVAESLAKQDALKASFATVQTRHAVKKQELDGKKGALAQIAADFAAAKDANRSALLAQKTGGKNHEALVAQLVEVERVVAEIVAPLASGTHSDKSSAVSDLMTLLPAYDIDRSMLTALPSALAKAANERGQFDVMAVTQLTAEMDKRVESLRAEVAKGEPAKHERDAAVEAAQAALEAAKTRQLESADTFSVCQTEMKAQDEALANAEWELANVVPEINRGNKAVEHAKFRLSKFEEGTMAKFSELQNRSAPPLEPEATPAAEVQEAVEPALQQQD